jgi:hypothetical protein
MAPVSPESKEPSDCPVASYPGEVFFVCTSIVYAVCLTEATPMQFRLHCAQVFVDILLDYVQEEQVEKAKGES